MSNFWWILEKKIELKNLNQFSKSKKWKINKVEKVVHFPKQLNSSSLKVGIKQLRKGVKETRWWLFQKFYDKFIYVLIKTEK